MTTPSGRTRACAIIIAFCAAALVAALAAAALVHYGVIWLHDPDPVRYPVRGIDVSHHQGAIEWSAVGARRIDFAFIKATEGGDHVDSRFAENWRGAASAGIARGAYHFFTLCRAGSEQARNFISIVPRENGALPPVVDLEYEGNCRNRPAEFVVLDEIKAFLDAVERRYGVRPILYVTREFYDRHLRGALPGYRIWLRAVYERPVLPDGRAWDFWQYSSRGRVAGIDGRVDLNVFRGTRREFDALVSASGRAPGSAP